MPTIESNTWCPTPARSSAASRFAVTVPKKSTICASSSERVLQTLTTTSTPASALSSPAPVYASTPVDRLIGTVSCPDLFSVDTVYRPIRPVAPSTATRMAILRSMGGTTFPLFDERPISFSWPAALRQELGVRQAAVQCSNPRILPRRRCVLGQPASAERAEECLDIAHRQVRCLHGREVATPGEVRPLPPGLIDAQRLCGTGWDQPRGPGLDGRG